MGIRETLNKNSRQTLMITIPIIVVVVGLVIWFLRPEPSATGPAQYYFTIDDGANTFTASRDLIPPFKDETGKEAVRAHVYKVDGANKVQWLEKYTDAAKAQLERVKDMPPSNEKMKILLWADGQRLMKLPGGKDWVKYTEPDINDQEVHP